MSPRHRPWEEAADFQIGLRPIALADWLEGGEADPAARKDPLFRSAIGKTGQLSGKPVLRGDVWRMVRRRASDAGIETAIGCHTFRATGITDYLTNGGRVEVAQRMAGHSNAKTTGLYDRRTDDVSLAEVAKIGI